MEILNPSTGDVIENLETDDIDTINGKVLILKEGLEEWGQAPLSAKLKIISKWIELLKIEQEELAKIMTLETGKPISQSRGEIAAARKKTQFFIDHSEQWLSGQKINQDGNTAEELSFEPMGVIANISAWNYPYLVGVNIFIPALLAGNVVLYKPSEFAALTGLAITRLLHKAGIPESVFQCAIGGGEIGKAICDMNLDGYYFTGSRATGLKIASQVGGRPVPMILELGGKDPLYVADDVSDVALAANNACDGAFYNAGQSCCAVERIYVHEKIHDEFVEVLCNAVKNFKWGKPMEEDNNLGAITRPQQIDVLLSQIKDAVDKGATLFNWW